MAEDKRSGDVHQTNITGTAIAHTGTGDIILQIGDDTFKLVPIGSSLADISGTPPVKIASTLPREVGDFTGRDLELSKLLEAFETDSQTSQLVVIHAIDGMAGVGKSALAVHAAHRLESRFPDGQLFVQLHAHTAGQRPVDPGDVLSGLLRETGMEPRLIPPTLDEKERLWRDRLAGKRILLLLDDAATHRQVQPLIPGAGGCAVLVTSRRRLTALEGAIPIPLDVMAADEAALLFHRLCEVCGRAVTEPEATAELMRLAGYLPLAIRLLAGRLGHSPAWTVADLAGELAAALDRSAAIGATDEPISAAFDLSYNRLPDDRKRFFRLLGLHPGTDIDTYAAAALANSTMDTASESLRALFSDHLIDEPARGHYRFHDLVGDYARALASTERTEDKEAATDRLLDYYQHVSLEANTRLARWTQPGPAGHSPAHVPDLSGRDKAKAWLRAERANLEACLDYAASSKRDDRTVALSEGLAWLLRSAGPWSQALAVHGAATAAAARVGDSLGQGNALVYLGQARLLTGDYPGAVQDLQRAIDLFRHLGDRLGQANALSILGQVRRLNSDPLGAARDLQQACDLYLALGDRLGQANVLSFLGQARRLMGDQAAAAQDQHQALALFRVLGDDLGLANALTETGLLRQTTGDYQGAVRDQTEALGFFRALGDDLGQANALANLGAVESLTGNHPDAERDLLQAHVLHVKLGNQLGQANALIYLGRVRMLTRDYAGAERDLQQAFELCRNLGSLLGQAIALTNMGRLSRLTRDFPGAARYLQQALELSKEPAALSNKAHAQNEYAALLAATGDVPGALATYREASRQGHQARQPDNEAIAAEGIGECLLRTEDKLGGIEYLTQALAAFQGLGMRPDAERVQARLAGPLPD